MDTTISSPPLAGPDTGTAYGHKPGHHDPILTEVGAGTPCGEFLRRYWHPVALSSDITDKPMQIRVLGEDLVLFRDGKGRPGLLYPRCCHRGTTLYYGKCEDEGIRCCYHGWMFAVDGTCVDQPCEPEGGKFKGKVRQPWYPVQDQYGLVWAYLGPPEKKPLLAKYDIFENLGPDDYIEADDWGASTGGLGKRFIAPCNWMQHWENAVDPAHVRILHIKFTGFQFTDKVPTKLEPWVFDYTEDGVKHSADGYYPDGTKLERCFQVRFPGEKRIPDPYLNPGPLTAMGFTVAIDDDHYMVFAVRKHVRGKEFYARLTMKGKTWPEMTETERRDLPSDYEAQTGQGPITLHSEEHLATSDQGVMMLRRLLKQQIERVARGENPAGTIFDPADQIVVVTNGNYYTPPPAQD